MLPLARDIASRLGVKVSFNRSPKSFNEVVELVAQGAPMSPSPSCHVHSSGPRWSASPSRNIPPCHAVQSPQARPAYARGGVTAVIARAQGQCRGDRPIELRRISQSVFPHATAVPFKSWDEAVAAVFAGKVLAIVMNWKSRRSTSRKDASLTLKTVIYKDMKDYIAMAVAWNRPTLPPGLISIWTHSPPTNGPPTSSGPMDRPGETMKNTAASGSATPPIKVSRAAMLKHPLVILLSIIVGVLGILAQDVAKMLAPVGDLYSSSSR